MTLLVWVQDACRSWRQKKEAQPCSINSMISSDYLGNLYFHRAIDVSVRKLRRLTEVVAIQGKFLSPSQINHP